MTKVIKNRKQLIKAYTDFFKTKNHKEIPNSSLVPENDPTVLFTTAGMHPLIPFLTGEKHPLGKRLVNVQRCIRTQDINEVGDNYHHTFFEMLGNWSLGDYFKKEAIQFSFEFLTKVLKIPVKSLGITCFGGDKRTPKIQKDEEAVKTWQSLGIPKEKISFQKGGVLESENNWWGPAGKTGPCGPDTEMHYWRSDKPVPKKFNPEDERWVEIWNDVFMQYKKDKRLILVDGMHCIYDKNFKLNKELLEIINNFNTHTILTVNGSKEKGLNLVKNYDEGRDTNWEAFSLEEEGIKKDNPEYFQRLLKLGDLIPEETIYFDHDKKSVETAKKLGILSRYYTNPKSIKKFIEDNLWVYLPAKQKNIDTGMGVERTIAILNKLDDDYLTEVFLPIIKEIEKISRKKYGGNKEDTRAMRIIADHIKAATFILAERVRPSNTERGYVLRRLIRRAIRYGKELEIPKDKDITTPLTKEIIKIYSDYPALKKNQKFIINELNKEEEKFEKTLEQGLNKFKKFSKDKKEISGKNAFLLYQSYGFPLEMTKELAAEKNIVVDEKGFEKENKKHQELSRTATAGKFKSGLADESEKTKKLHTATHLLNQALREVLKNPQIYQRGSNITPERTRFDFNFDRKLTEQEKQKIEDLVNKKIKEKLPVKCEELSLEQAKKYGAQGVFEAKYKGRVKVYSIGDFSKEICAGPHVKNTSELGHFKIKKEESSSAGVRRIKSILE